MRTQAPPAYRWTDSIENTKNVAQILALIIAAWWSYNTLVKPELFRPDDYAPHLLVEADIDMSHVFSTYVILNITMRIANDSKDFIHNLGAMYEAMGYRSQSPATSSKLSLSSETDSIRVFVQHLNQRRELLTPWHFLRRHRAQLISTGRILPDDYWFAPGEEFTYQISTYVPCEIDILHLTLSVIAHSADTDALRLQWRESNGRMSWIIRIIEGGQPVDFDPDNNPLHKKIALDWGLIIAATKREIALPIVRRSPNRVCIVKQNEQEKNQ